MHGPLAAVVQDDPVADLERTVPGECSLDHRAHGGTLVRVDAAEEALERERMRPRIDAEDAEELARPGDLVRGDLPLPATEVGETLRLREALARLLPLGQGRAEDEQADRDKGEQRLQNLHLRRQVAPERRLAGDDPGDRDRGDGEASRRRPELAKAERRPDEEGEDRIRVAPQAAEEDRGADARKEREQGEGFERSPPFEPGRSRRPDEENGRDQQVAHGVAEPPEHPRRSVRRRCRRARERKRRDAVRRRHCRAEEAGEDGEREHVAPALERGAEANAAEQVDAGQRLECVTDRDRGSHLDRHAARRVADERAEGDSGPEPRPEEHQRRKGDPGRRPDRGDHAVRDRQLEPQLC